MRCCGSRASTPRPRRRRTRLPMVVLGHPGLAARCRRSGAPTVFIPVATPGIGERRPSVPHRRHGADAADAVYRDRLPTRGRRARRASHGAALAREGSAHEQPAAARRPRGRSGATASTASGATCACATAASSRRADGEVFDQEIDASGCVVMAGGIDLHTHIGGGKVNLARLLMPEDHRDGIDPIALPANPLELASCGRCTPGTLATGYRYVEMGYTAAFEPAMVASNARHAHMEMGDVPMLDHGAYVMLGNDELFLQLLAEGGPDGAQLRAAARLHRLDHGRHQGDGREGGQPGRHLGLQVQPAQARRRRARTCTGRSRRARWCTRWRARCANWACRIRCTSTAATSAWPATSNRRCRPSPRWRACRRT